MTDPRISTALRQLVDHGPEPDPPDWRWTVARLEPSGRLVLPAEARVALGIAPRRRGEASGLCVGSALVLRAAGRGWAMTIDGRGRLYVPVSLRRTPVLCLLVGSHGTTSTVMVAPTSLLDGLADRLLEGVR